MTRGAASAARRPASCVWLEWLNNSRDAGMPSWKTAYSKKPIEEILGFLSSIQR
jgi:hypothetical protein